jgi:hypothetical protein
MADNENIAAILTAGMLHPVSPPARAVDGAIEQDEQVRFVTDVLHAVGLYRAVLKALGDQPKVRRIHLAGLEACEGQIERPISHFRDDR